MLNAKLLFSALHAPRFLSQILNYPTVAISAISFYSYFHIYAFKSELIKSIVSFDWSVSESLRRFHLGPLLLHIIFLWVLP